MRRWLDHSTFTDPGEHAGAFSAVPADPARAMDVIQGLLIHGGALEHYGLPPGEFDRETLSVSARLGEILGADERPLDEARPPKERTPGTCRDYALLLCSAMRGHGVAARVRCGFATYLGGAPWEDHWICEVQDGHRWRRIDAQLDTVMRQALGVDFDPADLPDEVFLTADEAWRRCRTNDLTPTDLGHGEARGLWFAHVDLMRDRLALRDRVTSPWDGWRQVAEAPREPNAGSLALADRLTADQDVLAPSTPWWERSRTDDLVIRNYRLGDAPHMAQLYFDSVRAIGPRGYSPEQVAAWAPEPADPVRFHARAADGRTTLIAENAHGEVIAYGDLEADGHIDHLYCRPDAAGTGVASRIVEELTACARTAGCPRLYVEASELARPLFEHKGFRMTERREFRLGETPMHNYAMERALP